MEESLRDALPADDWRSSLARRVQDQRQRTRDQVEAQRQRLRDLESRLTTQLDEAVSYLAREQEQLRESAGKSGSSAADFDRRTQELATAQSQLAQQQQRLAGERESLQVAKTLADSDAERLREQEAHLRQLESELAHRQQQLAERERTTQRQRRHVADQLRARKKELTAEIELHRSEALANGAGQEVQLQMRLAELQGKHDRLREDLAQRELQRDEATQRAAELKGQLEAHVGELARQQTVLDGLQQRLAEREGERLRLVDVEQQLAEARQQLESSLAASRQNHSDSSAQALAAARLAEELERQRAADQAAWGRERSRLESELAALRKSQGSAGDAGPEVARLREENKQLEAWLAEAEEKAKHAASGAGDNQELADLQRRFEMAVQDVRDLKTKNNELADQLTKARQNASAPAAAGGGSDWESMKRKLLEQLETDLDPSDEKQAADKLTVEGTIKITDEMIARKEEEIRELQRLLDSQSQNVGEVAVGASAIAQMLDADELVKQERENLQKMQDSLREQLRKAEVDISLERAKLARERAELDEKLRAIEEGRASGGAMDEASGGGKGGKQPARGKWLTRLGLQGGKDE